MTEVLGYFGAVLLAACGLPLLFPNRKNGELAFLYMWLVGEIALLLYVLSTTRSTPLLLNYSLNTLLVLAVLRRRNP